VETRFLSSNAGATSFHRKLAIIWNERWAHSAKLLKPESTQRKRDWRSCWNLGCCYFKIGNLACARKYLIRSIQFSPKNAACKWLGIVYIDLKQFRKAEKVLTESL
jgi:uncharacterized protein HemY